MASEKPYITRVFEGVGDTIMTVLRLKLANLQIPSDLQKTLDNGCSYYSFWHIT